MASIFLYDSLSVKKKELRHAAVLPVRITTRAATFQLTPSSVRKDRFRLIELQNNYLRFS